MASLLCELLSHIPMARYAKGQLISKCHFDVIVSTKIPTEKFDKFYPTHSRAEFVKFSVGNMVETMKPKGHFEIN
jgi:hypothetical protein